MKYSLAPPLSVTPLSLAAGGHIRSRTAGVTIKLITRERAARSYIKQRTRMHQSKSRLRLIKDQCLMLRVNISRAFHPPRAPSATEHGRLPRNVRDKCIASRLGGRLLYVQMCFGKFMILVERWRPSGQVYRLRIGRFERTTDQ
ncbi:hypothetical protein EVAR_39854_1 [Eumeta japonica]|uniref:Uncharacterized protein n=1 Tax=Eumeta variegata TaxID=151549 RepID=A0A4C1WS94_EUMVA|nr:hypothetical protein EVAR_39854_1 [Eumeta japonica]